jgi:hypothetical protein
MIFLLLLFRQIQNHMPQKETVKVSFTLQPLNDELPSISTADG